MEGRAALLLDGLQHRLGIEALARVDHRSAMRHAREVAQYHAEAMVERHRNTQPVLLGEAHRFADEEAVVENIVVGERSALGQAGRAGSELNVDGIVELQP